MSKEIEKHISVVKDYNRINFDDIMNNAMMFKELLNSLIKLIAKDSLYGFITIHVPMRNIAMVLK